MMRKVVGLLVLQVALLVSGCGTPVSAPPGAPSSVPSSAKLADQQQRYHDGQRWVTVTVLLDRLFVERGTAQGAITAREVILLRTPVVSVAELEDVARQMRVAQPDIRSLSAFFEENSPAGIRRQRLTREVAVRAAPGVDLATMVVQQGARVVRTFTDTPDIIIVESAAPDLLAAFTLAERLRTAAGVLAAIPLGE